MSASLSSSAARLRSVELPTLNSESIDEMGTLQMTSPFAIGARALAPRTLVLRDELKKNPMPTLGQVAASGVPETYCCHVVPGQFHSVMRVEREKIQGWRHMVLTCATMLDAERERLRCTRSLCVHAHAASKQKAFAQHTRGWWRGESDQMMTAVKVRNLNPVTDRH